MKIDELIEDLKEVREEHGNLEIRGTETTVARQKDVVYMNNYIQVLKNDWKRPEINY